MLSRDGVIARFILAFCCFFLSGTEILTGGLATLSGVIGVVELATAMLQYSPAIELYEMARVKMNGNVSRVSYHPALKQR